MPTIYCDFEEIYLNPTPKGWEFTLEETSTVIHLRVEIDADDRESWGIKNIHLVERHKVAGENRFAEATETLSGALLMQAEAFINSSAKCMDDLQDEVNKDESLIPSSIWGEQGEAGRRL
jgi:hypothetical protein